MTHGPPWVRRIVLAAGLVSLAAAVWALLCLYYSQGRRGDARRLGLQLHAVEPDPRDRVQLLVELLRQDALTPVYETLIPALEPAVRARPKDLHTAIALSLALVR